MGFVQPQRRGGCGGGQVHGDAGSAEPVDHMVEPLERERALDRLDLVPAENCQRYDVHAGLTHETDILVQRLLGPLVRVVVAAERDAAAGFRQQGRPPKCSMSSHSNQILYCIGLREVLCLQVVNTREAAPAGGAVSEADWGGGRQSNPHMTTLSPLRGQLPSEGARGYSLTAPAARPDCQYFCRHRNAITRGMIVISEPVITRFWIA